MSICQIYIEFCNNKPFFGKNYIKKQIIKYAERIILYICKIISKIGVEYLFIGESTY